MQFPKKVDKVYVEVLDDEVCVYDWEQTQMHALNPTAALVWEQCDGQTSPEQMAARLEQELTVPNGEKLVALSLARLEKARLLDGAQTQRTITRREVLKMAGIGAALLPVVTSLALPSMVQAQSCASNCTFTTPLRTNCTDSCTGDLITGEILCDAEDIGMNTCQCTTRLPAGTDPANFCGRSTTTFSGERRAMQ